MAASLLALLSQQLPNVQTRKGLILTDLQQDFLSLDGKLPVCTASRLCNGLRELIPAFRQYGDVVWVRSHFLGAGDVNRVDDTVVDQVISAPVEEPDERRTTKEDEENDGSPVPSKRARVSPNLDARPITGEDVIESIETGYPGLTEVQDEDEMLFRSDTRNRGREPCMPNSFGAEYATQIKDLIDDKRDIQIVKTCYSVFASTSLLLTLRSKLITELYICGCITNLSVFATAMDAARYGIKVTLIEDCLGYWSKDRHDLAIKQLREIMGADVMTSTEVIDALKNPPLEFEEDDDDRSYDGYEDDEVDFVLVDDEDEAQSVLLESGTDGTGEDLAQPIVRPPTLSGRMLGLRCTSPMATSLPVATAAEPKPPTVVEAPEPVEIQTADTSSHIIDDARPRNESNEHNGAGQRENDFALGFAGTTGGVPLDYDSFRAVGHLEPSVDIVHQSWENHKKESSKMLGKSSHPGLDAISAITGLDQATVNTFQGMMEEARQQSLHVSQSLNSRPLFGNDKEKESAGSRISYDLLPEEMAASIFEQLNGEVNWQKMHHQTGEVPRLVCCQGTIGEDNSIPAFRHPSDQTLPTQPWTQVVDKVRRAAEEVVGHSLNHALIQLYRGGSNFISEHSDKTLDIVKGSSIVNVSYGAQRTMRLRTKRAAAVPGEEPSLARTTYRVPMPHNSIITMSLPTNAEYLHGISADKRPAIELSEAEKAYGGQRISITFRNIGTFLNEDSSRIWGQGATGETKDDANPVINGDVEQSEKLIRAFGAENQSSIVQWEDLYGSGSDVLHLK